MNNKNLIVENVPAEACVNVNILLHEAAIREKRTSLILDNASEGIIYYCLSTQQIIDCNRKTVQIFGTDTKKDILLSESGSFYMTGMSNEQSAKEFFSRIIKEAKKSPYTYVYQARNSAGEKLMIKGRVVFEDNGLENPILLFFLQDVTANYKANEEMTRLFDQQKQIIDAIPAPFIFKDLNNNILACNQAAANKRGFDHPDELAGKNIAEFVNQEEAEAFLQIDLEIARTGEKGQSTTYHITGVDSKKRWYRNDKTPFRNQEGKITGILSYLVDITDITDKNERLKSYIESNKQLNNFASIASHDLQAPLRTIQSFTQLLQRKLEGRLTEEEIEYMQFISSATDNMRHLIRDLRTYSQVDAGRLNINQICLDKMVKEILSEIKSTIDLNKAVILLTTVLPVIQGDRIKLKQLVQNLLTNALKYVAKGVVPKIAIHFQDQPKYWYLEIKDNGIGIDPAYQNKIFQLFQRLHANTEEYPGTGIGLSLCKKVVEQHQGSIGVRSAVGAGSTFYFTIAKEIDTVEDLID